MGAEHFCASIHWDTHGVMVVCQSWRLRENNDAMTKSFSAAQKPKRHLRTQITQTSKIGIDSPSKKTLLS
jgi:hypothetical protein